MVIIVLSAPIERLRELHVAVHLLLGQLYNGFLFHDGFEQASVLNIDRPGLLFPIGHGGRPRVESLFAEGAPRQRRPVPVVDRS